MWAEILRTLNVAAARSLSRKVDPHLPQPKDDQEALVSLHMARAQAACVPWPDRWYSYDWLRERGYVVNFPGYVAPTKVTGVMVAVLTGPLETRRAVGKAMSDAVADCYANGDEDPSVVKPQMMAARARERRGLMLSR